MADLQKGLIGHWTMNPEEVDNGVVRSRAAQDYHAEVRGSPKFEKTGPVGGSVDLVESDGDYLPIRENNYTTPNVLPELTVSAWVKSTDGGGYIMQYDRSEVFRASLNIFATSAAGGGIDDLSTPSLASNGSWHHIVYWYDNDASGERKRIYIDNQVEASRTDPHGGLALGQDLTTYGSIGSFGESRSFDGSESPRMNGKLSDVRLYERALTDSEINQLYNFRGNSRKSQTTVVAGDSLQAWYPFLQSGAADKSGNGNDGTVNGATYNESGGPEGLGGYEFNGDSITTNFTPFSGKENVSISVWFNANTISSNQASHGGSGNHIFGTAGNNGNDNFMLGVGNGNELYAYIDENGTGETNRYVSGIVSTNTWHHAALVLDSGTSNLYFDGSLVDQKTGLGNVVTSSGQSPSIGSASDGLEPFDGSISDARIYNLALSQSEINQLYDPESVNLDRGLVGHWSMDNSDVSGGTVYDRTAYENHATIQNGPSTSRSSPIGESFSFDGSDDYLQVSDTSEINPQKEITVSAWVNLKNTGSGYNAVVDKDYDGAYAIYQDSGNNEFNWYVSTTNTDESLRNVDLKTDTWHHIVGTYESQSGEMNVYKNGQRVRNTNISGDLTQNNSDVYIGLRNNTGDYWNGNISDVRIYNRALTEKEINALYNKRTTTSTNSEGIIAEVYDTGTYYSNNGHPSSKSAFEEFFDTTNTGVNLEKKRVHNRPHIFFGNGNQNAGIGNVNSYPYYITVGNKGGYSWKIESTFVAPETGTYTFGVDSDDASDVLIDGNVVTSYYGGHGFSGDVSNHTGTISLTKDVQYDFAARFEEGGGGDGIAVAWQKPSESSLSKFPLSILSPIQE